MIRCLIIEDEAAASDYLKSLIAKVDKDFEVVKVIESVKSGIEWLANNPPPDIIFADIQIADGLSFEIFEKSNVKIPVIFTTAYNEFAIKAFKINSIDYLLKPINPDELRQSINKFKDRQIQYAHAISDILKTEFINKPVTRRSFLVNVKDRLVPVEVSNILCFYLNNGIVYAHTNQQKIYVIEMNLETIHEQLNLSSFFRANRQYIINRSAISEIHVYFNNRLNIKLVVPTPEEIIISKERVSVFKKWLEEGT